MEKTPTRQRILKRENIDENKTSNLGIVEREKIIIINVCCMLSHVAEVWRKFARASSAP